MGEDYDTLEKKHDKLEDAISKLTEISGDLNRMLAVHELRLNQQEKVVGVLEDVLERRREESEVKLRNVYETIKSEDKEILRHINELRKETVEQYEKLSKKISDMERMMWMYMGGFAVILFAVNYAPDIVRIMMKI